MSFIDGITNAGATPVLGAMLRFAGARQRVVANNIANIDTPDFRPVDADPRAFQSMLGEAIDERRSRGGAGDLELRSTRQVEIGSDGRFTLHPGSSEGNVLFHDRNNRDVERLMQDLAENTGVYRIASELLRARADMLRAAIRETR